MLEEGFGTAGAMVILFCIFLLSCILLTQRSFVSFFKKIVKDMKTSREEWKKAAQQKQLEREAAATEDILINLDEEETPDRTKSFLKMKNGKKKTTEKRRTEQCEEKVKELEERRSQKESAREKTDKTEPKKNLQDLKVNVPLFTSSDEVKRKDCVKELHPRIYPFTEEDGKTEPFQGKLDFSAFTFPDEIKESTSSFEEEKNQKDLDLLNLIVLSHVLPKSCAKVFTERKQTSRTEEKMDEILERFGSSIKAWYAGHYHINEERNMSENWKGEVRIFYDCFWKE